MGRRTKSRSTKRRGMAGGILSKRRGMAGGVKSKRRGMAGGVKSKRRGMSGGDASNWIEKNFGSGDQQFNKVFLGNGPTDNSIQPLNSTPSQAQQPNLALIQSAGGKRRRQRMSKRMGRSKKGGFLGPILSTAAAPLALFGLSYKYGRRSK